MHHCQSCLKCHTISDSTRLEIINKNDIDNVSVYYYKNDIENLKLNNRKIIAEVIELIEYLDENNYIKIIDSARDWTLNTFGDYKKTHKPDSVLMESNQFYVHKFKNISKKSIYVYNKLLRLKENKYLTDKQISDKNLNRNNCNMFLIAIIAVIISLLTSGASIFFNSISDIKINSEQYDKILKIIDSKDATNYIIN